MAFPATVQQDRTLHRKRQVPIPLLRVHVYTILYCTILYYTILYRNEQMGAVVIYFNILCYTKYTFGVSASALKRFLTNRVLLICFFCCRPFSSLQFGFGFRV